jgi:hypothetical protein
MPELLSQKEAKTNCSKELKADLKQINQLPRLLWFVDEDSVFFDHIHEVLLYFRWYCIVHPYVTLSVHLGVELQSSVNSTFNSMSLFPSPKTKEKHVLERVQKVSAHSLAHLFHIAASCSKTRIASSGPHPHHL